MGNADQPLNFHTINSGNFQKWVKDWEFLSGLFSRVFLARKFHVRVPSCREWHITPTWATRAEACRGAESVIF
ncbi:Uncharacterized protein HZ326_24144 [Fusarium oxysporum f. sp. albedinis]|nr:Uncharacterized protein HZ326_24144 [Fusarium oxysporum f. sp. albedinis]